MAWLVIFRMRWEHWPMLRSWHLVRLCIVLSIPCVVFLLISLTLPTALLFLSVQQIPERDDSIASHSIDEVEYSEFRWVHPIYLSIRSGLHFLILQFTLEMLPALFLLGDTGRTGSIPSELWTMTQLEMFDLFGNYLTGTIPPGIGSLNRINAINFQNNDCKWWRGTYKRLFMIFKSNCAPESDRITSRWVWWDVSIDISCNPWKLLNWNHPASSVESHYLSTWYVHL